MRCSLFLFSNLHLDYELVIVNFYKITDHVNFNVSRKYRREEMLNFYVSSGTFHNSDIGVKKAFSLFQILSKIHTELVISFIFFSLTAMKTSQAFPLLLAPKLSELRTSHNEYLYLSIER